MKIKLYLIITGLFTILYGVYAQSFAPGRYYILKNRASSRVVSVVDGTNITLENYNYSSSDFQKFRVVEYSEALGGGFRIETSLSPLKCFNSSTRAVPSTEITVKAAQIDTLSTTQMRAQRFVFHKQKDSYFNIVHRESGRNLLEKEGKLIQEYLQSEGAMDEAQWEFLEVLPYKHINGIVASQIGYRLNDKKRGVYLNDIPPTSLAFSILSETGKVVYDGAMKLYGEKWGKRNYVIDFSDFKIPGKYHLVSNGFTSYSFSIDNNIWREKTRHKEYLNNFMVYQRWKASVTEAATDEAVTGYEVTLWDKETPVRHPEIVKDVRYGWFSATSRDKHVTENSIAVNAFLYAYTYNPDFWDADLKEGLPAVLDEAKYGFAFLLGMQDMDGGVFPSVHPGRAWYQGEVTPNERFLVINKGTGVTARAASSFALGYTIFKDKDAAYASKLLNAARKSFEWLRKHPNQFLMDEIRPPYWAGRYDNVFLATVEMYMALRHDYPQEAIQYKEMCETIIEECSMTSTGVWDSKGKGRDYTDRLNDNIISSDVVFALARYYQVASLGTKIKVKSELNKLCTYWKEINASKNPYGWIDRLLVSWFGGCGYFAQAAPKFIFAGYCLDDPDMIELGKAHVQAIYGVNPFAKTYVYGEGKNTFSDIFGRVPHEKTSIGAVAPGMKLTNKEGEKTEGVPIDDYRIQGPDYSTGEACVPYTPMLMLGISLLDRDELFSSETSGNKESEIEDGQTYFLMNEKAGKVCTVKDASMSSGDAVVIETLRETAEQRWKLKKVGQEEGDYWLVNENSNLCLYAQNINYSNGAVTQTEVSKTPANVWTVQKNGSHSFRFVNKAARRALDIDKGNGSTCVNGTGLVTNILNGNDAQLNQWWSLYKADPPTALDEIGVAKSRKMRLFPNPVKSEDVRLEVDVDTDEEYRVNLINSQGSIVYSSKGKYQEPFYLPTSALVKGMYLILLQIKGQQLLAEKIIVL